MPAVTAAPIVDVNLIAHDSGDTVGLAIESVLSQTWPSFSLTLIDDGSTDHTLDVMRDFAARDSRVQIKRNRCNGGAVANFQRAFWIGDADFVMPKSGDDVLAPEFMAETMEVLLAHPRCAMCHAGGLVFHDGRTEQVYPAEHRLSAIAFDPVDRAKHVMSRYTSSPSFWGIYRREAVDRTSRIPGGAGWDHVFLAELALAGEIRHVPKLLYWRRDGGKPVLNLARAATTQAQNGLSVDDELGEQHWRTPLITTAFQHIRMAASARLPAADRHALIADIPGIFRARWLPLLRQEAERFRDTLPYLLEEISRTGDPASILRVARLRELVDACASIIPEVTFPSFPAMVEAVA
jgi:Glycosyl transferase family 2